MLDELLSAIQTTAHAGFFEGYSPGWTDDRLRRWLDATGEKYTQTPSTRADRDNGVQYNFAVCPLCREAEGNPAVWLNNGEPCFKCFRARHCDGKTFADVQASFKRPSIQRVNALELTRQYSKPRESVVHGLIRKGDVVNIIGGPKARKSFLVAQLALSVASGTPFLAWPTAKGRVLLIDNELQGDDIAARLTGIARAMHLDWPTVGQEIDVLKLRGTLADLHTIRDDLRTNPGGYSLIVLDALYKALPEDTDENSNGDMTRAYVVLDSIAESNQCATTVVHHLSKGSQQNKSISDMGSGAGAQSRSADAHIVLREGEDEDVMVVSAIVRSLAPVQPVCIRFRWPLWELAADADPQKLAIGPNRKATVPLATFVAAVPTKPTRLKFFRENVRRQLNLARDTVELLLEAALEAGHVKQDALREKGSPKVIWRVEGAFNERDN